MRWWPWPRRRPAPAAPARELLPWHHEGLRGDFKRAAVAVVGQAREDGEVTEANGAALFDAHARFLLDMSAAEFLRRWDAGELTWDCAPGVTSVTMLIPFARPSRSWADWDCPEDAVYDEPGGIGTGP